MRKLSSEHRTGLALVGLFSAFLFGVIYSDLRGREIEAGASRGSLNARPVGAKALYLLCQRLGYATDRLQADWRSLRVHDGLLVVIEPFAAGREPTLRDRSSLLLWAQQGGSVLYSITSPPRSEDLSDPVAGGLQIVPAPSVRETLPVLQAAPCITLNVQSIAVQSPVRIKLPVAPPYRTLIEDEWGAILLYKRVGAGSLFLVANDLLTSNSGIAEADNAVLLVNIVSASLRPPRFTVLFDEYHHGAGIVSAYDDRSTTLWSTAPIQVRLIILYLAAFLLLQIYSGNHRFGPPRAASPANHPARAQFLYAMVRVMRTAFAGDLVIETLYRHFREDLTRWQRLAVDVDTALIIQRLEPILGQDAFDLGTLMVHCDRIVAGDRITDEETLLLARQIDDWHRRLKRVGL